MTKNVGLSLKRQNFSAVSADDEIDLFELLHALWRGKWWVAAAAIIGLLVAIGYLLVVPSVYRVQSNIEPVAPQQLAALSVPGVNYLLTPEDAIGRVQQRLASWGTRKAFFLSQPTLFNKFKEQGKTPEQAFEAFDGQHFVLHLAKTEGKNLSLADRSTYIQLTYPEGVDGVAITNGLMAFAIAGAKKDVIASFKGSMHQQLSALHHQVASLRNGYYGQLRHRQSQLEKALVIAKQLDIKKTSIPQGFGGVVVSNTFRLPQQALFAEQDNNATESRQDQAGPQQLSAQQVPLYYLGVDALAAQLSAVKHALAVPADAKTAATADSSSFDDQSLDSQIQGLYKLKQEGHYLTSVRPDFSALQLVDISRQASTPTASIKPRKLLVLAIALLLGLMLGCALALVRAAWHKRNLLNAV